MHQVRISTGPNRRPIEVVILGKLPKGAGRAVVKGALERQRKHPEFLCEHNEPSSIIAKTCFEQSDPTAVYTFGVDKEPLVYHRHAGHRVITGITGAKGCILRFCFCAPEEAARRPEAFIEKSHHVRVPGDRLFMLRFSGLVYHQFRPVDPAESAFFAVSVHTNEAGGLTGALLKKVLRNESSIPLLTDPAPEPMLQLMKDRRRNQDIKETFLDL